MTTIEDIYRLDREEHERAIDRNCRILELARHNGFDCEVHPANEGRGPVWIVPRVLQPLAGAMALIVR